MGKTTIYVSCIDQRLVVTSPPVIASGGLNEDRVKFDFCPLWDGFEKIAVFYRTEGEAYHAVVTDDLCLIPHEVLADEGFIFFGVFGVKGDITRTSEIVRYRVVRGILTEGTVPSDPTPDIYEQILRKLSATMFDVRAFGVFPDTDCSEALQNALAVSRRLYFPAGEYRFSGILITRDTVLVLDPGAHFRAETTRMLTAYGCSLSIYGGTISCGENFPDRHLTPYDDASRNLIYQTSSHNEGVIELYGCHDCVFEGINVPYSSAPSLVQIYGDSRGAGGDRPVKINGQSVVPGACTDIRFNNCRFNNTLLSAIHVLYHNKNILTDGCTFTNALRGRDDRQEKEEDKFIHYCYTIYTGVKSIGVKADKYLYFTPTDGYVFKNCYVENCEGTGVDTHAASNVLYENNTFIDCDSFITAYHDYQRVRTAEGWVMENIIVRNNRCITTKAIDYQYNEFPHNPFMLYNRGPEGAMRNIVVENNLIDTNWYHLSESGTVSEVVCLLSADGVILRNNTIISRGETAVGYYIARCNGVVVENQTFKGTFNYGFQFLTSVIRMGAVFCMDATFNEALMRIHHTTNTVDNSISPFFCVVDTDGMTVDNTTVTDVSGWKYSLNRYGKPLQSVDSILPLGGNVIADVKGCFGKNDRKWIQDAKSVDGKRVTVSSCRMVPGMRFSIGADNSDGTDDPVYCVMRVESYWENDDATAKTYVYVLDRDAENPSHTRIRISAPYIDKYSYITPDDFSQTWGEIGESTDFNDYTTPGVYRTNNRPFTNAPFENATYSRLEVSYSVTSSTLIQKLYAPPESVRGIYIRYKMANAWTPWRKLATEKNAPVLIDTITITESVNKFSIDKEPDGTPYAFTKMVVRLAVPPRETLDNWTLYPFKVETSEKSILLSSFPDKSKTYYATFICDISDGFTNTIACKGENPTVFKTVQTGKCAAAEDVIRRANLYTLSGIPVGTVIEIEAIRA